MSSGATPPTLDRRAQRTREGLLDALRALLPAHGYERLTIQQLLDRADVGRATFYAHFESKDDLLRTSLEQLRRYLVEGGKGRPSSPLGFTLPLFRHLDSHRVLYHMLVVPEHEVTVEREMRVLFRGLVRDAVTTHHRPSAEAQLTIEYIVGALWSTIVWWMEDGGGLSAEQVNARFEALVLPGLAASRPPERSPA